MKLLIEAVTTGLNFSTLKYGTEPLQIWVREGGDTCGVYQALV